jgi:hypothetical protein
MFFISGNVFEEHDEGKVAGEFRHGGGAVPKLKKFPFLTFFGSYIFPHPLLLSKLKIPKNTRSKPLDLKGNKTKRKSIIFFSVEFRLAGPRFDMLRFAS